MKSRSLVDKRKSIYLFILVFISYSLIYMTKNCYSAAMASIVSEGIMTKSQTGLISAAFYLIYAPFQIVGGIAADKYSPGKLILIGFLGAGIANLLIYFIEGYVWMIIIWSCNAVVQFGVWPSIFKIVSTELSEEIRHSGLFYISMSSTFGLVLSYILAAIIKDWKDNFLVSAIVLFSVFAIFLICYRILEKYMISSGSSQNTAPIKTKGEEKNNLKLRAIITSGMPIMLCVGLVHNMLNLGVKSLVPVMLMESYTNLTPTTANILNIILILAAPIGLFFSLVPIFRRLSPIVVISIWFFIAIPMLILICFIGKIPLFLAIGALAIVMLCMGPISLFYSYMTRKFEKFGCVATVSGCVNAMASLGIVLANFVFARIADSFGWLTTTKCWLVLSIVAFILCIINIPIWKRFVNKNSL